MNTTPWLSNTSWNRQGSTYLLGHLDTSGGDITIRQGSLYVAKSICCNSLTISGFTYDLGTSTFNSYQTITTNNTYNNLNGYFCMYGAIALKTYANNDYFAMGAGESTGAGNYMPNCTLVAVGISTNSTATSNTLYYVRKNGAIVYTLTVASGSGGKFDSNLSIPFSQGDTLALRCGTGSYSGSLQQKNDLYIFI